MISQSRTRTTDKRYYGIAEGIVTDVNDPQKEGRIKVKFPWFDDQMESEWCRVRQYFAGDGHGAFFIPEVDAETPAEADGVGGKHRRHLREEELLIDRRSTRG